MSGPPYDLVVAGAGMAGLTAAASVAARGGRVVVLEKATAIGGSAILSGGMVWTAEHADELIEQCPNADPALIRILCERLPRLLDWIRDTGATVNQQARVLGYGLGHTCDLSAYFDACQASVVAAGGEVITRAQMFGLLAEDGAVGGVEAFVDGEATTFHAGATLLAGGGFQADPALLAVHVHENAPGMLLRGNRASSGDGLRAGLAVGAATSETMNGFYGHLISWPADVWNAGVFTRLSQYHSDLCALINLDGDLFRPPFDNDHYNTQWAVKQRDGRAVMVMDQYRYDHQEAPTSLSAPLDRFAIAVEHGANAATAETLEQLGERVCAWGFAGERLPEAVATFNATLSSRQQPLVQPPFYALEVKPGITFTHGGLRIDGHARVISTAGEPIAGLYAAGADAGGVFDGGYGGGLSAAGVFAMQAADHVLGAVDDRVR